MGVNPWSSVGDRNYPTSCPGRGRADSVDPGAATGDPKWSRVRGSVARWEQSEHVTAGGGCESAGTDGFREALASP